MNEILLLGAVAYDPKVVTIWEGFKKWFEANGLPFDYILYSNYERQVDALLGGQIHIAWNSPLAWVRAKRLAAARGADVEAIAMRDTDCDLKSVIVVRADSPISEISDLNGKVVGVGAVDSPQATLLCLSHLRTHGLTADRDFAVRYFDVLFGKHGDHVGGERDAARALAAGEVDAACMIEGNYALFAREGTLPPGMTRVLTTTTAYDHCNFTVGPAAPRDLVEKFKTLLFAMSYEDPELRPLMDLEGLKAWLPARTDGYAALERAVDEGQFYAPDGALAARTRQ